jgi:hypothetical protein
MNAVPQDAELVDMTDAVNDLCDEIMVAIEDSALEPAAALCACMQVIFDHISDEVGMATVRDLFAQFESSWRAGRAEAGSPYYQPHQGVLQ